MHAASSCLALLQYLEELDGEEAPHSLSPSTALKFSNNMLSTWEGFASAVQGLLLRPLHLGWVDLSFNDLHSISTVSDCWCFVLSDFMALSPRSGL